MVRFGRLGILFTASVLLVILLISTFMAGMYISSLAHPACNRSPSPISTDLQPQEHWIRTREGRSLRIWYYPPRNGAVILALGGSGGALGDTLPPVSFLIDKGYGAAQVDQRGCSRPPAAVSLGAKEEQDAEAVIDYLLNQNEVKKIGAFGFSMGGVTAIRTAARRPEIAAVVAEGGYYNLGDDLIEASSNASLPEHGFLYLIASIYWIYHQVNPWQVSPIDDLPNISPRPVFLIYGENEAASGHAVEQYQAAREPKKLWIVPRGAHGTNAQVAPEQYQSLVLEFFGEYLLP